MTNYTTNQPTHRSLSRAMPLTSYKPLKICLYNINSFRKYKQELIKTFPDIDIFALNETRLPSPEAQITLPGYTIYRHDRHHKVGGGVLLAIKQSLQSNHIFSGTIEHNEITAAEIKLRNNERLLLASIYCPPEITLSKKALLHISNLHHRHLILGDLNAKHVELGCKTTNKSGRILDEWIIDRQLEIIGNSQPTFQKGDHKDKIDWIVGDTETALQTDNYEIHSQLGETSTGHSPISFELKLNADVRDEECARKQFVFTKANWKLYTRTLNQGLKRRTATEMNSSEDLVEYNSFVTKCIVEATEKAVPTPKQLKRTTKSDPSEVTLRLIKEKHRLYRRMVKESQNQTTRAEYNRSRKLVRNSLANDSANSFKKLLSALSAPKMNSQKIWATVNRFQGKRISREIKHELKFQGETARFDEEKVEIFRKYFEKIYQRQQHTNIEHTDTDREVIALIEENRKTGRLNFPRITKKELKFVLDNLGNTAIGHDGVHNKCLKRNTKLLVTHLLALFNSSFALGYVLPDWKLAHIILIHKPDKDPNEPSSYRPISLLSCIGKVMERIVKLRLNRHAETNKLLPEYQAGFRQKRSTTDNLLQLKHNIELALSRNRHVALITFDIKGAFDAVWHNGLLSKLNEMKVPKYLWCWIHSFLFQREAKIEYKATVSNSFFLQRGTPQGSPLSPLLYILYTADSLNDIPSHTQANLFADDTSIWSDSNTITNLRTRLQQSVELFVGWCKRWKLQVQPTKTKLVHFCNHPRRKYKTPLSISIDGQVVPLANEAKYLGITFDKTMKFKTHLKEMKKKTASRIGLIKFLARNTEGDASITLNNLQKSLVRSIITYAAPIYLNYPTYWKTAQITQNQAIKAALGVPRYTSSNYTYQKLPEQKLFDFCTQTSIRYLNEAIQVGNSRILNILLETIKLKNTTDLPLTPLLPMITDD